jgi:hypothetical protein
MNRGLPKGRRGFGDSGMHRFSPEVGRVHEGGCGWGIRGQRVDPASGAIQKGGFFGCFDTDARAALRTGIL